MRAAHLRAASAERGRRSAPHWGVGLGHYLPHEVVPNEPIAERLGVDQNWIVKRTGIRSRRRAGSGEQLVDAATSAGRNALEDAGVNARDVDLVLVATLSHDELMRTRRRWSPTL